MRCEKYFLIFLKNICFLKYLCSTVFEISAKIQSKNSKNWHDINE